MEVIMRGGLLIHALLYGGNVSQATSGERFTIFFLLPRRVICTYSTHSNEQPIASLLHCGSIYFWLLCVLLSCCGVPKSSILHCS